MLADVRSHFVRMAALAACLLVGSRASAFDLGESDGASASIGAAVRAGYRAAHDARWAHGPWLQLGRLSVAARHVDAGGLFLQVETRTGTVELLDARADIRLTDRLSWNVGRYKTPVSYEHLIGAPDLPWSARLPAVGILPRRLLGTSIACARQFDSGRRAAWEIGVFDVPLPENPNPMEDDLLAAARVMFEPVDGMQLHVGASSQIYRDDHNPADFGTALDAAVSANRGRWRAVAEGAVRLDDVVKDASRIWSVGGWATYAVPTPAVPFDVAPMAGVDYLTGSRYHDSPGRKVDIVRARAGLRLPWRNAPVQVGAEGDVTDTAGQQSYGLFVWGQVRL